LLDKIKRLGTDTAVYGVSTILGRFLTFFLTPFYTHILPPAELGIVATMYAYIAVLNVVYVYGMESAYMKYVSTLEGGTRKQTFTLPVLSVVLSSILLSGLGILFRTPLASAADLLPSSESLIVYSALILFFDAAAVVPYAELRMARKARLFAGIKLVQIVINVICNLVLLMRFHMGVEGIFISNVVSSGAAVLMLLPTIVANWGGPWSRSLYRALLMFGLPYVPAGLAAMIIQVINRPILEVLKGRAAVGIFQANYRLGIFMMLLVSMFDFAWRPFFLSHAADPDAKPLFARIMTYAVLLYTIVLLVLGFFIADIVKAPIFGGHPLVAPAYWGGLNVVPVILLAYLFLGIYNNLVAGIYIEKKTGYLPLITAAGALVSVVANYLLIPPFDLMGAAIATLLSYVVMAGGLYIVTARIYPVHYEWGRIAKIAIAAAGVWVTYVLLDSLTGSLIWKGSLIAFFLFLMFLMRFFTPGEMRVLVSVFRKKDGGGTPATTQVDETPENL
jgi:O-antigen/teichoic acid export membrane protein